MAAPIAAEKNSPLGILVDKGRVMGSTIDPHGREEAKVTIAFMDSDSEHDECLEGGVRKVRSRNSIKGLVGAPGLD